VTQLKNDFQVIIMNELDKHSLSIIQMNWLNFI